MPVTGGDAANLKLTGAQAVGELVKLAKLTIAAPGSSTYIIQRIEGLTGALLSVNVALEQGSTVIVPVVTELEQDQVPYTQADLAITSKVTISALVVSNEITFVVGSMVTGLVPGAVPATSTFSIPTLNVHNVLEQDNPVKSPIASVTIPVP